MQTFQHAETDKGKCVSCGFLAKCPSEPNSRHTPAFPKYYEIEINGRQTGEVWSQWIDRTSSFPTEPTCFVFAYPIRQEIANLPGSMRPLAAKQVFALERNCPDWFAYVPGFSPQEHFNRYEMQRLELDRREFELKLAEITRKAHEDSKLILADSKQIADDSKNIVGGIKSIAEQMAASSTQNERFSRRIAWLVVLLAILQVVIGTFALTSDSWVVKIFQTKVPAIQQPIESEPNPSQ